MIPSIVAIILAIVGIVQCNKNPEYSGKGMGIAGLIIGIIVTVFYIFVFVAAIALAGEMLNNPDFMQQFEQYMEDMGYGIHLLSMHLPIL